jgi:uncharacterized protein with PQ loop repeat
MANELNMNQVATLTGLGKTVKIMKTKFNNKVIFKALAIASTALVAFNVWANTGNSIYTNISGVNVNVPTFYANSPIGYHTNAGCFTAAGGVLKPYVPAGGVVGTATDTLLNPNCDSGTALRKFVDQLPLPALPGGLAIPKSTDKSFISNPLAVNYIPVALPSPWVNPMGVSTSDDYYEIAVVEYKQKMHTDLANPTVLRGYVQIDPYTTDLNAGLSNGASPN